MIREAVSALKADTVTFEKVYSYIVVNMELKNTSLTLAAVKKKFNQMIGKQITGGNKTGYTLMEGRYKIINNQWILEDTFDTLIIKQLSFVKKNWLQSKFDQQRKWSSSIIFPGGLLKFIVIRAAKNDIEHNEYKFKDLTPLDAYSLLKPYHETVPNFFMKSNGKYQLTHINLRFANDKIYLSGVVTFYIVKNKNKNNNKNKAK